MTTYSGSCHCRAVRFEADGPLEDLEVCNCSICRRTGYVHWYLEPDRFRLESGEAALASYRFGSRVAQHLFCRTCGISPFRRARSDPHKIDVNVRCLEGVEPDALSVTPFDGRNWEETYARLRPGRPSRD